MKETHSWASGRTNLSFRMLHTGKGASLVAQPVKNPPAMQETPVRFLGQEDALEKGPSTHSSIHGLPR